MQGKNAGSPRGSVTTAHRRLASGFLEVQPQFFSAGVIGHGGSRRGVFEPEMMSCREMTAKLPSSVVAGPGLHRSAAHAQLVAVTCSGG